MALIKSQEDLDEVETFETQKISDALLAEFGFELPHLELATEHHKTEESAEFNAFREELVREKEAAEALLEPSEELLE